MNRSFPFLLSVMLTTTAVHAQPSMLKPAEPGNTSFSTGRHVVLISIDGFHPDMYLDSSWPAPNLRQLMKKGVYARHMKSVFPSYTYPSHTAMVTGALPARSGIYFNQPKGSKGEWNWFTKNIKAPTLWQAVRKAGLTSSAVEWPVSVDSLIDYNIPEIWSVHSPEDRIGETRKYATPGLIEEIERNGTGPLNAYSMNENFLSLDANAGRIAAYIFRTYHPSLLALHFACVDGAEHDHGRDDDSVRLALAADDRAIGDLLETIQRSGLGDSTTILIVGDHGFSTIHTVFRPNLLIRELPARFTASGGSAFLYLSQGTGNSSATTDTIIRSVIKRLDSLPEERRNLFRVISREELDRMGADSAAILALAAVPGTVFSGSMGGDGLFINTTGGHHGYDPDIPDMYTGFIAAGAGIGKGVVIPQIGVQDIAPLIAKLLGIYFSAPDGKVIPGILR